MSPPLLLFAPGAGAPSSSKWMQSWRDRLLALGNVVNFDYLYMQQGRKSPDRLPTLISTHRQALAEARSRFAGPIVLIGKSMGSRVGCHVALEEPVAALVCLGFPLKAPNGALRDQVLLELRTPILFIQGSRDTLCPLDSLAQVRSQMSAPNELHVVQDANHSLEVPARQLKARGESQEDINEAILQAIQLFLERHASQ